VWQRAESVSFDWVSIWDHFQATESGDDARCFEAIAAHAALAASTSRVRCGSLVYCAAFRNTGLLAKALATIDHVSGGRAELGLGAGWLESEFQAFGIPFPSASERLDILEETVQCVRALFGGETVTFKGAHVALDAARCEPAPVQSPLPIWVGGRGERRTLRIAAEWADGWNVTFITPDELAHKRGVLHDHCREVGRDPAEIRCAMRDTIVHGSPAAMRARLREYEDAGADQINFSLRAPFRLDDVDALADLLGLAPL
jgi:probable F420-dependent oxidoreductase